MQSYEQQCVSILEIDRYIILSSSYIKYDIWDQKYYIFTWYMWKWVGLSIFKNFTNECCSRECTLCLWEKFVQGLGLVEDVWKHGRIWSKVEHCIKVWYSNSQTCLGQSVCRRPLSPLAPQRPVSHRNACELSRMEVMVRMADNGMGSNIYRCVRFPRSAKNMVL